MNIEEYYKKATKGYLELLDTMVEVARKDSQTTPEELSYVLGHREFTKVVLESLEEVDR
jgi:hypothetical protein